MDQWCRFEDAHFVLVGGSDFTRISAAIQGRDPNVVVHRPRDNLHPLEVTRQDNDIASRSVRCEWDSFDGSDCKTTIASIAGSAQYLVAIHGSPA